MDDAKSWSSLPYEIQSIILSLLPLPSLILCSAVNHEWKTLSRANALWKELFIRDVKLLDQNATSVVEEMERFHQGDTIWLDAYKRLYASPTWDATYTDPVLLRSPNNTSFGRDNGRGLFPRAFAKIFVPPRCTRWIKVQGMSGTTEIGLFVAPSIEALDKELARVRRDHWYGSYTEVQYDCCIASGVGSSEGGLLLRNNGISDKLPLAPRISSSPLECVIKFDNSAETMTWYVNKKSKTELPMPVDATVFIIGFLTGCPNTKGTVSGVTPEEKEKLEGRIQAEHRKKYTPKGFTRV